MMRHAPVHLGANIPSASQHVFWAMHLKPADDYAYFVPTTTFNNPVVGTDLWASVSPDLWFAPTQLCISYQDSAYPPTVPPSVPAITVNTSTFTASIKGIDQFGFPLDEFYTFESRRATAHQGTRGAFVHVDSITVLSSTSIVDLDTFQVGIARSKWSDQVADDKFRLPSPVRLRDTTPVGHIEDVTEMDYFTHWKTPAALLIDPVFSTLEFTVTSSSRRHFLLSFDPAQVVL
jgi:hypothetical protein